jgi:hypothetical protein
MKCRSHLFMISLLLALSSTVLANDVPIPCDPVDCKPIDPCKLNPDRCKDKGGPIEG